MQLNLTPPNPRRYFFQPRLQFHLFPIWALSLSISLSLLSPSRFLIPLLPTRENSPRGRERRTPEIENIYNPESGFKKSISTQISNFSVELPSHRKVLLLTPLDAAGQMMLWRDNVARFDSSREGSFDWIITEIPLRIVTAAHPSIPNEGWKIPLR